MVLSSAAGAVDDDELVVKAPREALERPLERLSSETNVDCSNRGEALWYLPLA